MLLLSGSVFGHGVQIRWNITPQGNIRVWLEHWHSTAETTNVSNFPLDVTVTVNGGTPTNQIYSATGVVNGTAIASLPDGGSTSTLLYGCTNGEITSSGKTGANTYNNWVYWDFPPPACNVPVTVTINNGTQVTTNEGCGNLYPQTIVSSFNDITGPAITANDVNVGAEMSCDSTIVSSYGVTATDACGYASGQTISYSIPEGSTFNIGSTKVIVTATDSVGNVSTDSLNVIVTPDSYTGTATDAVCSGDSFTFPDNHIISNITSQVSHTWTIARVNGCDSTVTTTVNVNPTYNQTQTGNVCYDGSYTFPGGVTVNNIIADTVYTSNLTTVHTSCDSVIVSTITVDPVYNQSNNYNVCYGGSYTFPDGVTITGIISDTVHTSNLTTVNTICDSTIVDSIYVRPTYGQTNSYNVCYGDTFTFPDGYVASYITSQFIHISNLTTVVYGCDSIIVDTLFVNPVYNQTQFDTVCYNADYTLPDGTYMDSIPASFTYTSSLSTVGYSCDSTIVSNIYVRMPKYSIQYLTLCFGGSYSIGTSTYAADGVYVDTISTTVGCDSIVTTQIVVTEDLGQSVTAQLDTLVGVSISGATYQWLECSNNYAEMTGETTTEFKVLASGSYALETTKGACVDTSDCYQVALIENFPEVETKGDKYSGSAEQNGSKYVVIFEQDQSVLHYQLINNGGVVVLDITLQNEDEFILDLSSYQRGTYYLKVEADGPDHIAKIVR